MRRKNWTKEDEALLRGLRAEGKPMAEIARALGRSEKAVAVQACKLGLARRKTKWSDADVEQLGQMLRAGKTDEQIARILKRTVVAVRWKSAHARFLMDQRLAEQAKSKAQNMPVLAPVKSGHEQPLFLAANENFRFQTCQFIHDDGQKCGAKALHRKSWCEEHHALVAHPVKGDVARNKRKVPRLNEFPDLKGGFDGF